MISTQNITVDLSNPYISPAPVIYAKQGDSKTRAVSLTITDNGKKVSVKSIFKEQHSRSEIVATFLAVLELCKSNRIKLDGNGNDMSVRLNKERKINETK